VINLSLAGPSESSAVSAAIDQVATDTSRGKAPTIVVAGAGNSGTTYSKMWPAAHPRVIAVAATDGLDGVASFSSRGSYVDVAAPGMLILSTCVPATYCYRSGTSMAAPAVTAVAALLRDQDPARNGSTVETILETTAFDADAIGQDTATGWGRVDAAAALDPAHFSKVPRPVRLPVGSFDTLETDGRFVVVRGRASDPDGTPIVHIESTVDGKRSVRDMWAVDGSFAMGWNDVPGTHRVCASVLDTPTRRSVSLGCRDVVVK
jgi:subtilisin family serine protease